MLRYHNRQDAFQTSLTRNYWGGTDHEASIRSKMDAAVGVDYIQLGVIWEAGLEAGWRMGARDRCRERYDR